MNKIDICPALVHVHNKVKYIAYHYSTCILHMYIPCTCPYTLTLEVKVEEVVGAGVEVAGSEVVVAAVAEVVVAGSGVVAAGSEVSLLIVVATTKKL